MAAKAGHVDIVKYLVENGAEVNAWNTVRIYMYNITYRLPVFLLLYSFQNSAYNYHKTYSFIPVLCFCWIALIVT